MADSAPPPALAAAQDLIHLIRLAAMDGYNKNPVATVEDWVEDCKKRIFLLATAPSDGSLLLSPETVVHLYEALIFKRPAALHGLECDTCVTFRAALQVHGMRAADLARKSR